MASRVRISRPLGAVAACMVVFALALVGAGCGGDGDQTGDSGTTPAGKFEPQQAKNIKGNLPAADRKLWKYDSSNGRYEVVPGDASSFTVKLDPPAEPFTLAYMDPWGENTFAIPIRDGVERYADELGLELIYCDAAFKAPKAIECAELLARQKPDFAIAGNWQAGASNTVMSIFDEARIPTASIDVWQPNSIFFGADNYTSGVIGGKAAGEFAKEEWDCEDVWVFLGENKEEGEAADQRLVGFADGVQEVCGALPEDQIQRQRMSAATGDQAQTVTTDWLTANPQATHVLGESLDDPRATGIAKAFAASGRDAFAAGMTCDTVGVETVKQAPPEQNHFLGCVAFLPEKYADYLVSIALEVAAGEPVPEEVHVEHKFIDNENVDQFYP